MTVRTPASEEKKYRIDPKRASAYGAVGVPVMAERAGVVGGHDVMHLDAESFNRYLRSKGGRNDLAEDLLRKVLGHPAARPD